LAPRRKVRRSPSLLPRLLSALVLIPLCLYVVYLGPPYSLVLGGIVALGLFMEWGRLLRKCTLPAFSRVIYGVVGTLYLGVAVLWLLHHMGVTEGWRLLYWLFFLVWTTDSAAFVGGRFFEGPRLAPSISPNKTWSGFVTGLIGGVGVGYGTSLWLFPGVFTLEGVTLLVLIAQGGDLLESQAKRWSHMKDSSTLIPGHGGLLDRLDSLLAVSFALALWQLVY
jgi:phosphatidate cytidylyltransferase